MHISLALLVLTGLASAACPYIDASPGLKERSETPVGSIEKRDTNFQTDSQFLAQFIVDDTNSFLTSDVGGPIEDNHSLKAGERGPTLLEDFIFRQKIQHFDHERASLSINTLD
jgi:catalase